mgnify:CR=1 FL=1
MTGLAAFTLIAVAGVMEASAPGGMDEDSPVVIGVGFGILSVVGISFVGLFLGVGGFMQGQRNRLFAILGVLANLGLIAGIIGLIVIGLAMAG